MLEVRVGRVVEREAQAARRGGRGRQRRRLARERPQPLLGGREPGVGVVAALGLGQRDQVDPALAMVEGDDPVAQQERGVGERRGLRDAVAALGLELVAEVAREPADEVERQLGRVGAQAVQLAAAVVEDALGVLLAAGRALDGDGPRGDVVPDDLAERPVGRADEREPRDARPAAGAVEPDGVVVGGEQGAEDGLGLAPGLDDAARERDGARVGGAGPRRGGGLRRPSSRAARRRASGSRRGSSRAARGRVAC